MTNERILLKYLIVLIYFNKNSYLDGLHYEGYKYREFIKKIKNGTVEKNINRYSDKKIKIIRNLAEFYNLQSLKDTIDNVIMIKKLQGVIKDY